MKVRNLLTGAEHDATLTPGEWLEVAMERPDGRTP